MPLNFNIFFSLLPSALEGIDPIVSIVSIGFIVSIVSIVSIGFIVSIVSIVSIVTKAFLALLVFLALRRGFYQFSLPAPFRLCMYLSQSLWDIRLPNNNN